MDSIEPSRLNNKPQLCIFCVEAVKGRLNIWDLPNFAQPTWERDRQTEDRD